MRGRSPEVPTPPQECRLGTDTQWVRVRARTGGGTAVHRILIVEDSPTMRALLVAALEGLAAPVKITEADT
jgi:hypothetical protein